MNFVIEDADLRFLIAGVLAGYCASEPFPLKVAYISRIDDDGGQADAFRITTESGLRFRVQVAFEEG